MVLHPDIQEKARSQLDSVIGRDRLPNFSDRASLPYIEYIVQEIYRYVPSSLRQISISLSLTGSHSLQMVTFGPSG